MIKLTGEKMVLDILEFNDDNLLINQEETDMLEQTQLDFEEDNNIIDNIPLSQEAQQPYFEIN